MAKRNWQESGSDPKKQVRAGNSKQSEAKESVDRRNPPSWKKRRQQQASPVSRQKLLMVSALAAAVLGAVVFWINLKPEKKTPLVILAPASLDSEKSDGIELAFRSSPFQTATLAWFDKHPDIRVVKPATGNLSHQIGSHLTQDDFLKQLGGELKPGGPDKNVFLIYLLGEGRVDNGQAYLLTSKSDPQDVATWLPLADVLKRVGNCEQMQGFSATSHTILFLDCGRGSTLRNRNQIFGDFPSLAGKTLEDLTAGGQIRNTNLHLVISQSDFQQGWTSSELNSSVFGFHVAQGLHGWADFDGDQKVSFGELRKYLSEQVDKWARDYRDSNQNIAVFPDERPDQPILLTFAKTKTEPAQPEVAYLKTSLESHWNSLFKDWRQKLDRQPLMTGVLESRLIRLEELSLEPESNVEFNALEKSIAKEFRALQNLVDRSASQSPAISLSELAVTGNLPERPSPILLQEFADRLVQGSTLKEDTTAAPPENPASESSSDPSKQKGKTDPGIEEPKPSNKEEAKAESNPQPAPDPKDKFRSMTRERLGWLAWNFLISDQANISRENLQSCLDLIDRRGPPEDVELVELGFLRLLLANVDWESRNNFDGRMTAVHEALQCRDASERLIQSGALPSLTACWRFVESEFVKLESQRRLAEDQLLAGLVDKSLATYRNSDASATSTLVESYEALATRCESIAAARRSALETAWVVPHLQHFLDKEFSTRLDHSKVRRAADLKSVQSICNDVFLALVETRPDFDFADANRNLSNELLGWRNYLTDYGKLNKQTFTDSETLRIRKHLLESPLLEWIQLDPRAQSVDWDRAAIRASVKSALAAQAEAFFSARGWDPDVAGNSEGGENPASPKEHRSMDGRSPVADLSLESVLSPNEIVDLKELVSTKQAWSSEEAKRFADLLGRVQSDNRSKGTSTGLNARRDQLLRLDWIHRIVGHSLMLSEMYSDLDLNDRLHSLHRYQWNQARADRVIRDLWGDGELSPDGVPPFMTYAQAYRSRFPSLEKRDSLWLVESLDVGEDKKSELAKLEINWLTGDTSPGGKALKRFAAANTSVEVTASLSGLGELPTSVAAISLLDNDSRRLESDLGIGTTDMAKMRTHPVTLRESSSVLDLKTSFETSSISGTSAEQELQFAFRGHHWNAPLRLEKNETVDAKLSQYSTNLDLRKTRRSLVTVEGTEKEISDVVLILDCSLSMKRTGRAGLTEGRGDNRPPPSRLDNAKVALKELSFVLERTGRFRTALMAFAHRSKFKGGRTREFEGPVNPFFDGDIIVPLSQTPVTSQREYRKIRTEIDQLQVVGSTPLFYSILKAAEALRRSGKGNPKQLVVVTDGVNFQGNNSQKPEGATETTIEQLEQAWNTVNKEIKLHIVLMNPSDKPFLDYLKDDLRSLRKDPRANESAINFREKIELKRFPKFEQWVKRTPNATLLEANDGDVKDVREKLLQVIRFVKYSVSPVTSEKKPVKTSLGSNTTVSTEKERDFVVQMHESLTPAQKRLTLEGGERVALNYQKLSGLKFQTEELDRFFHRHENVPIGNGKYTVVRQPVALEFGVQNVEHERVFTDRPTRVWAEVRPKTKGPQQPVFYLFDYRFKNNQRIPFIEFPSLKQLENIVDWPPGTPTADVRLWISYADRADESVTPLSINKTYENIGGLRCTTQLKSGVVTVTVSSADATPLSNEHTIDCPEADAVNRTHSYTDGKLQSTKHVFSFDNVAVDFRPTIKLVKLRESKKLGGAKKFGVANDPFFGTPATWIDFEGVPLK